MKTEQINIYDPDAITPTPALWRCRETCKRFGEHVDYPSWWNGEARCLLVDGQHMKEIVFDNMRYTYCTLYERK